MSTEQGNEFVDCRSDLLRLYNVCTERYAVATANSSNRDKYRKELVQVEKEIEDIIQTSEHCTRIYKNIKHYANKHQERGKTILNLAIEKAGELIPDADVEGIHLNYTDNNRVTVVNGKGQNVSLREGGGFTTLLGTLLRYACIKAQPDALPLILFDESFFTLSDTTTEYAKDMFEEMKKDMYIICIEQRCNVMAGISDAQYTFKKSIDGVTSVIKTL